MWRLEGGDGDGTVPDDTDRLVAVCQWMEIHHDFFSVLFTEEMMEQIITQTNLYAEQFLESIVCSNKRGRGRRTTTLSASSAMLQYVLYPASNCTTPR